MFHSEGEHVSPRKKRIQMCRTITHEPQGSRFSPKTIEMCKHNQSIQIKVIHGRHNHFSSRHPDTGTKAKMDLNTRVMSRQSLHV